MRNMSKTTKKIVECMIVVTMTGILAGCGIDQMGVTGVVTGGGSLDTQFAQPDLSDVQQSILLYEEMYASGEASADDLRTLADLYSQAGMPMNQRNILEQNYRLFGDEESLNQLSSVTINTKEESLAIQETASQLFTNLSTEGYLNEAVSTLNSDDWFFTMMPKLTTGCRRYYLETETGYTLCMEVGYDENGNRYSAVWLTASDGTVLHLLQTPGSVYLLRTTLIDGIYQGPFETWLCLASSGSVYHEQGFYNNGLCSGEYSCDTFLGSGTTDLLSLWWSREDFAFTSYYGLFDNEGKTTLAQPLSLIHI